MSAKSRYTLADAVANLQESALAFQRKVEIRQPELSRLTEDMQRMTSKALPYLDAISHLSAGVPSSSPRSVVATPVDVHPEPESKPQTEPVRTSSEEQYVVPGVGFSWDGDV